MVLLVTVTRREPNPACVFGSMSNATNPIWSVVTCSMRMSSPAVTDTAFRPMLEHVESCTLPELRVSADEYPRPK